MSAHQFITCDACKKTIMEDDPPHQTRLEFQRIRNDHNGKMVVEYTEDLPRRDLCDACALRVRQALLQVPDTLWLLDKFEVQK